MPPTLLVSAHSAAADALPGREQCTICRTKPEGYCFFRLDPLPFYDLLTKGGNYYVNLLCAAYQASIIAERAAAGQELPTLLVSAQNTEAEISPGRESVPVPGKRQGVYKGDVPLCRVFPPFSTRRKGPPEARTYIFAVASMKRTRTILIKHKKSGRKENWFSFLPK
jgi:hypothetical protein